MCVIFESLAYHFDISTAGDGGASYVIEIPTAAFKAKLIMPKVPIKKLVKPGRLRINYIANARGLLVAMRRHRGDRACLIDC